MQKKFMFQKALMVKRMRKAPNSKNVKFRKALNVEKLRMPRAPNSKNLKFPKIFKCQKALH